jgi:ribose transport system permease protein
MQDKIDLNIGKKKFSFLGLVIRYRTILILILLLVIFTSIKPIFLHPTNLLNMLKSMSYTAIAAFGTTFVITLGGLDLSVGSTAAVVGVTLALFIAKGIPLPLAIIMCFFIAFILGSINGVVIVKGRIEPFLVTLATMNIYRGFALQLTGGKPIPINYAFFVKTFGNGRIFNVIPIPIIYMFVFFAITWFLYKKTKFGFYIRAIGGNLEAARVAGINISKIKFSAYALNAIFAFFAGIILAALFSSGLPNIATDLPLDAISAVILGGTAIAGGFGNVWGTLGGTLIMAILSSGMSILGAQYPAQILAKGLVIIVALLIDQQLRSRG